MVHRKLIVGLFTVLITVAVVEGGLRLFDPWGALRYYSDQAALYRSFIADPQNGYHPLPGVYQFSNWQATILPDGSRRVPDSQPNGCTVVFVGDSLTYGIGVNDADTWVNLLARSLSIHAINAGVYSYNAERVRDRLVVYPGAALFIYLFIGNDGDPDPDWQASASAHLAIHDYLYTLDATTPRLSTNPPVYTPDFMPALEVLKQRTVIVAFDTEGLSRQIGAHLIPSYTHHISYADAHPDRIGHQEIAAAMRPLVQASAERICPYV